MLCVIEFVELWTVLLICLCFVMVCSKKLIRRVQCRLKLLKNKRDSIVRQLRKDVVQLIKNGHEECAFTRIEQLYKDQSVKAVYDLLDNFCDFIIINLSYIRRHRDCPNDINEAVSSLLYASARCGDLPELIKLRKLFGERYGQKFAMTAVELHHGNLVNRQIIENLSVKSIPDDFKIVQMKEIARDNDLQLHYHEFDDGFNQQKHQQSVLSKGNYVVEWIERDSDRDIQFTYDGIDGSKFEASYANELQEIVKSTSEWKTMAESHPQSYTGFDTKSNTIGASPAAESASELVQASSSNLIHKSAVNIKDYDEMDPLHEAETVTYTPGQNDRGAPQQPKVEKVTGTASESPTHFSDRSIVYLDDVEELHPTMSENVKDKDQRLFMFKSNIHSVRKNRAATTTGFSGIYQDHRESCEPSDGKSSSRGASKRRKSFRKRLKQRYAPEESMSMKDVECALYYGEPGYSSLDDDLFSMRSYPQRKHQRKMSDAESLGSPFTNDRKKLSSPRIPYFYAWKLPEDIRCKEMGKQNISPKGISNPRICGTGNFSHGETVDCSLDRPCYLVISDKKDDRKILYPARRENKTLKKVPCSSLRQENYQDIQSGSSSSDEAFIADVNSNSKGFRCPTDKAIRKDMEDAEVIDCQPSCASSRDSYSRVSSPWTHARPPYLRALTMPPERPTETPTCKIIRSASCLPKQQSHANIGSPSYVHPKLPDYDDLTAKFKALREERVIS
ncbi:hypothetical protein AQUCO_05400043v1 [Aquilegia coerulea]|uniref:IST1-like protein n=1 Tax=Aquilegia coerulea TaxID=218851 RepID=A0A2G5CHA9_AQUCA|nr:hypothetical protein AQUCO_05400043v1 [Aquilegia coerulea]